MSPIPLSAISHQELLIIDEIIPVYRDVMLNPVLLNCRLDETDSVIVTVRLDHPHDLSDRLNALGIDAAFL